MTRIIARLVLTTAFFMASVVSGSAQFLNTFMLVPGVPGSSVDAQHVNWIDVFSLQQTLDTEQKGNNCSITVLKSLDIAGPRLWVAAQTGQVFENVEIDVVKPSGGSQIKIYEIHLVHAQVLSIADSGPSGASFVEKLNWGASSITLSFFPQNADGSVGAPVTATVACN